ncbi:MAG TPA: hypothetical protein VGX76_01725 [Pirellulales bacterium]|jgi:hypothetical protein|nr:hypothetical protein [Pirellulales bacterium]
MPAIEPTTRDVLNQLAPGDRVQVTHEVKVGQKVWNTEIVGTVERVERRRHGLHFRRQYDDKVFSDLVVLKLGDGTLSTVNIDEFTDLRKV